MNVRYAVRSSTTGLSSNHGKLLDLSSNRAVVSTLAVWKSSPCIVYSYHGSHELREVLYMLVRPWIQRSTFEDAVHAVMHARCCGTIWTPPRVHLYADSTATNNTLHVVYSTEWFDMLYTCINLLMTSIVSTSSREPWFCRFLAPTGWHLQNMCIWFCGVLFLLSRRKLSFCSYRCHVLVTFGLRVAPRCMLQR
jgi:hypothetical protein